MYMMNRCSLPVVLPDFTRQFRFLRQKLRAHGTTVGGAVGRGCRGGARGGGRGRGGRDRCGGGGGEEEGGAL